MGGNQHGDATHMSQLERRLGIHSVKDVFDGNLLGQVKWLMMAVQSSRNLLEAQFEASRGSR